MKKILLFLLLLNLNNTYCQNLSWIKSVGGSEYEDKGTSIAIDGEFIYLAGNFKANCVFNDGSNYTSYGGTDMFLSKYTSDGICLWTKRFGGTSAGSGGETDIINDIEVDTAGNVLVVGRFIDNCYFGDTVLVMTGTLWNGFIAKFDSDGNRLFVQKGASTALNINAVTVDPLSNSFYVTGDINANLSFGSVNLTLSEYSDVFVVKFNENGLALWGKTGSGEQEFGNEITCDEEGNVYIIGDAWGTTVGFEGNSIMTNASSNDVFIVKYNGDGSFQWLKVFGGVNDVDYGFAIHYDNNKLYATGKVEGVGTFGTLTYDAVGQGSFLMNLDLNGNVTWLTGGRSGTWGQDIGTDQDGNLFWYGTVNGVTNISNESISGNQGDIFIAYYDPSGNLVSLLADGGANQQGANSSRDISMKVDEDGYAYLTGQYYLDADFSDSLLTSNGLFDVFFAKYDVKEQANIDPTELSDLLVYPNPVSTSFKIKGLEHASNFIIRDVHHKEIMSLSNLSEVEISIAGLPSGIYFIQFSKQSRTFWLRVQKE